MEYIFTGGVLVSDKMISALIMLLSVWAVESYNYWWLQNEDCLTHQADIEEGVGVIKLMNNMDAHDFLLSENIIVCHTWQFSNDPVQVQKIHHSDHHWIKKESATDLRMTNVFMSCIVFCMYILYYSHCLSWTKLTVSQKHSHVLKCPHDYVAVHSLHGCWKQCSLSYGCGIYEWKKERIIWRATCK